jgi:aerobic C4-dicarboxylate transport protein
MSEGRALTNCVGNGVATMVIAGWQGERNDERFQAALEDPSLADPELGPVAAPPAVGEPATQPGRTGRSAEPVPALT